MGSRATGLRLAGAIAAAVLLSGCGATAGDSAAASATGGVGTPGVVTFLEFARAAKLDGDQPSKIDEKEQRVVDANLLRIGNAVCDRAAAKDTNYGRVVVGVLENTSSLAPSYRSSDYGAVAIFAPMSYQLAEDIVRASVSNLCQSELPLLPMAVAAAK